MREQIGKSVLNFYNKLLIQIKSLENIVHRNHNYDNTGLYIVYNIKCLCGRQFEGEKEVRPPVSGGRRPLGAGPNAQ